MKRQKQNIFAVITTITCIALLLGWQVRSAQMAADTVSADSFTTTVTTLTDEEIDIILDDAKTDLTESWNTPTDKVDLAKDIVVHNASSSVLPSVGDWESKIPASLLAELQDNPPETPQIEIPSMNSFVDSLICIMKNQIARITGEESDACSSGGTTGSCEEVGTVTATDGGIFDLESFDDNLYIGMYGSGSLLYQLSDDSDISVVSPGISVTESVCALEEFNGNFYANTESDGKIYKSSDGKNWTNVYSYGIVGCGLAVHNGYIYATLSDYTNGSSPEIVRSSDGNNWEVVFNSGTYYIRDIVSYDDKIIAFSVDDGKTYWHESSSGAVGTWKTTSANARFFRSYDDGETLWLGASAKYTDSGTSGVWKYDGSDLTEVWEDEEGKFTHITQFAEHNGNLYVGASAGFKQTTGGGGLLESTDGGETWDQICSFEGEEGVFTVKEYNDELYIGTWEDDDGGKGVLYKLEGETSTDSDSDSDSGGEFDGAGASGSYSGTFTKHTTDSRGNDREYYLKIPSGYAKNSNSVPLLIYLLGSNKSTPVEDTGFPELVDSKYFILAGPETKYNTGTYTQWVGAQQSTSDTVDEDFIMNMIDEIKGSYNIGKVYLAGFSNGAFFANLLALKHSSTFSAIAAHSGALPPSSNATVSSASHKFRVGFFEEGGDMFESEIDSAVKKYEDAGFNVHLSRTGTAGHTWRSSRASAIWAYLSSSTN